MLSDLFAALLGGPDQLRYFRHAYSPFSPWRRQIDAVVAEATAEAARYGLKAKVDRRRAYQVARMVVKNRRGEHLADVVPDAYLAFSPPSAATYHAGRRAYPAPVERRSSFRSHPQTLAYLLTPAKLARLGAGGSPEGKLVVIEPDENVDLEAVATRLHQALGGKVASGDLRAYGEILLRLHAGIPAPAAPAEDEEKAAEAA